MRLPSNVRACFASGNGPGPSVWPSNPRAKEKQFDVDVERAKHWLERGATPSETVQSILKRAGCFGGEMPKPHVSA